MTVQDIIDYAANQLLKKAVALADGVEWINDALSALGVEAGLFDEQQLAATPGLWKDLSADFLKVYEVRDGKGYDYYNWEADDSRIRFWDSDTYTVRYYKRPVDVVDGSSIPDCRVELHRALSYYIAFRFWKRNFPGEKPTNDWFGEYRARVSMAKSKQKKNTGIKVERGVR